jgi:hypothetical protein
MGIDPVVILILIIFIVLVIILQLIEKLIYHNDIHRIYGTFPSRSNAKVSNPYDVVVRAFTNDGQLLFNKTRRRGPGTIKSDEYAFSYQLQLTDASLVIIPRRILSSKHLVIPFDKIKAIQFGTQDLGELQPLETISAMIKIPELKNHVPNKDYYTFLQTYLSYDPPNTAFSKQLTRMETQGKAVYACVQTTEYSFLINHRYKFGVKSH